jgi:uncharacterized membrane protein YeiH
MIRSLIADLGPLLGWFDLFGIAVFAASGALAAADAGHQCEEAEGDEGQPVTRGGTVRDLLIGAPVFWVQDWRVPAVCLATGLAIWLTPMRIWNPRALDWFDAVGLAVYAVFGAAKSLSLGVPPLTAVMMGIITGCVGGIIRDVLAGVPSILLRPEIYVTAAALAAGLFVVLTMAGLPGLIASAIGATAGFVLRALAISRGLKIPAYRGGDQ